MKKELTKQFFILGFEIIKLIIKASIIIFGTYGLISYFIKGGF